MTRKPRLCRVITGNVTSVDHQIRNVYLAKINKKEVRNLKANNVKLEKKLENMTHELKLCQERCIDLEDRLHKEKNLDEESRET